MNEDFVSFSLAKKLKEKGFDEECLAYYTSEHTLYLNKVVLCDDKYLEVAEIDYEECLRSYNTRKDRLLRTIVDAPTISQVLKWLREEKKIHVLIAPMLKHSSATYHWGCEIYDISRMSETVFYKESLFNMSSHNEAALSGIKYVIDNLI